MNTQIFLKVSSLNNLFKRSEQATAFYEMEFKKRMEIYFYLLILFPKKIEKKKCMNSYLKLLYVLSISFSYSCIFLLYVYTGLNLFA